MLLDVEGDHGCQLLLAFQGALQFLLIVTELIGLHASGLLELSVVLVVPQQAGQERFGLNVDVGIPLVHPVATSGPEALVDQRAFQGGVVHESVQPE